MDTQRHKIGLLSNQMIKFYIRYTKLPKILNSLPKILNYYRCVKLWDQLSDDIQRATSKVKFEKAIR